MFRFISILALCFLLGCGGPSVTFPEPRAVADDEEVSPAPAVAAAKPPIKAQPQAAQRSRSNPPGSARAQPKLSNRAEAVSVAANRAAQGGDDYDDWEWGGAKPRGADVAPSSARPADLAAWTPDDFRTARQVRDVRLVQAVALLGPTGDEASANARLLIDLLDAPATASSSPSLQLSTAIHGLPQAIVSALATNKSDIAHNALKEILLGKLQTNLDDRTFTVAALKALIENGNSETESLLFAVLTMPEAIRPHGRGTFTADALQKECLNLVRGSASPQLRLRVAQYLANPVAPPSHRTVLLPMLLEQRGDNVPAQAALALAENFDANQRTALQRQMFLQLRRAMDSLMHAPDTPLLHGAPDAAIRAVFAARQGAQLEETTRVTAELWTPAFVKRLAGQLSEAESATQQADLFALATSIPSDILRPVVYQHLSEHWLEGASLITTPQFTPGTMRDPGMLLVLKALPREMPTASSPASRARGNSAQQQRLAQERRARQAWTAAVYTMVQTLMRRCEIGGQVSRIAAGQAPTSQASRPVDSVADLDRLLQQRTTSTLPTADERLPTGTESSSGAGFPLDLPPTAEVEASYALRWPEQLEGQVHAAASPLTLHYTRLRFEDQGQRAVAFFARQLKGAHERPLEHGRWLDSDSQPTPGKYRSIDVFVTRAKPAAVVARAASRNAVEELAAEILWIEVNDFLPTEDRMTKSEYRNKSE